MRMSDLYAQPSISVEHWTEASWLDSMFDVPLGGDWSSVRVDRRGAAAAVPLTVEAKLVAPEEGTTDSSLTWSVYLWEGRPFGATVRGEHVQEKVVTDPIVFGQAFLALMSLNVPLSDSEVRGPDEDAGMDVVAGQVVIGEAGALRVVPARFLSDRANVLLEPHRLKLAFLDAFDLPARRHGAPGIDDDGVAQVAAGVLLAGASPMLRRADGFEVASAREVVDEVANARLARMYAQNGVPYRPSPQVGWLGLLVADAEGTYVVGLDRHGGTVVGDLLDEVTNWRVGAPEAFDALASGRVFEVGEEPVVAGPTP